MSWKKSWKRIGTGCTRCTERSSLATNETKMQFRVNKLTIRSCYVGTYEYGARQLLGNYLSHKQHCICRRKNFSRWKIVPTPFHFCFLLIPYERFIPPFNFAWLMLLQIKGTFVITFNAEMGNFPLSIKEPHLPQILVNDKYQTIKYFLPLTADGTLLRSSSLQNPHALQFISS